MKRTQRNWLLILIAPVWLVGVVHTDEYFDRITMASNGRLTRFERDAITVYVDSLPSSVARPEDYQNAVGRALRLWEGAIGGALQFVPAASVAADIRVFWAQQLGPQGKYENMGEAALVRQPEGGYVEIEMPLRDATTRKAISPEATERALLHEIGHAIGLWGHSDDPNDVMYFAATAAAPTDRDVATWWQVRQTPMDTPFHAEAIQALQAEIAENSGDARNHYLLGMVYADQGSYAPAIAAFQRALALDATLHTSSVELARRFQANGMYDLAMRHYKQALRTEETPDVLGGARWHCSKDSLSRRWVILNGRFVVRPSQNHKP